MECQAQIEKRAQQAALGLFAVALVVALIVAVAAQHLDGPGPWTALRHSFFTQFAFAGLCAMYVYWERDKARLRALSVIAPAAAALPLAAMALGLIDGVGGVSGAIVAVGFVGLCFLLYAASCGARADRRQWRSRLPPALFLPLGVSSVPFFLWLSGHVNPVFDLYVFAFEEMLGARFSVLAVNLLEKVIPLGLVSLVCYMALPFGIAALYVLQRRAAMEVDILVAFAVSMAIGFSLYFVFPVVGPLTAYGDAFPFGLPPPGTIEAAPLDVASLAPRNGMPSLHATAAYLIWLNARPLVALPRRLLRGFALFNLFGAMGLPDAHWITDLIVAVPLTLAVQALCNMARPLWSPARWSAVIVGFGLVAAWFALLWWGQAALASIPGSAWLAVTTTLGLCLSFERLIRGPVAKSAGQPALIPSAR